MPEAEIEISVRMADPGEVGYRVVSAAVSTREGSVQGAPVAFRILDGPGSLTSSGDRERLVESDEWGIAEVNWYPLQHSRDTPEASETQTIRLQAACEADDIAGLELNYTDPLWRH